MGGEGKGRIVEGMAREGRVDPPVGESGSTSGPDLPKMAGHEICHNQGRNPVLYW